MKTWICAALFVASTSAFGGQMKEIYTDTLESIVAVLGVSEDNLMVKDQSFISMQDADLAVATVVQDNYTREYFECMTKFDKTATGYQVRETICN